VQPELSVVIPIYNEAPNLEALHREFRQVLVDLRRPYELLLIDDGRTDGSFD
jgi:glycosyltransferase involved in cell wall biosynthesis